jgi:hypothetical protein
MSILKIGKSFAPESLTKHVGVPPPRFVKVDFDNSLLHSVLRPRPRFVRFEDEDDDEDDGWVKSTTNVRNAAQGRFVNGSHSALIQRRVVDCRRLFVQNRPVGLFCALVAVASRHEATTPLTLIISSGSRFVSALCRLL